MRERPTSDRPEFAGLWLHESEAAMMAEHFGWTEGLEYKVIKPIRVDGATIYQNLDFGRLA